jgi:hypothetical protein
MHGDKREPRSGRVRAARLQVPEEEREERLEEHGGSGRVRMVLQRIPEDEEQEVQMEEHGQRQEGGRRVSSSELREFCSLELNYLNSSWLSPMRRCVLRLLQFIPTEGDTVDGNRAV